MANKLIEIAQKAKNHEIDFDSPDYIESSEAIKEAFSTTDGRVELAQKVYEYIQHTMIRTDISQYIFVTKTFQPTDKPVFKEKKKGIRAYFIAPNSATPKSQNYDYEFTMEFDTLSVAPNCALDDLTFGKIESLATLIADAAEAVRDLIDIHTYAIIKQSFNATTNVGSYTVVTGALTETALSDSITKARKTGKNVSIICTADNADTITGFTKFKENQLSDSVKNEIYTRGFIGYYKGARIVILGEDSRSQIPHDLVFIVSDTVGYAATKIMNRVSQKENDIDWTWEMKCDFEKGWVITHPEYICVIQMI